MKSRVERWADVWRIVDATNIQYYERPELSWILHSFEKELRELDEELEECEKIK